MQPTKNSERRQTLRTYVAAVATLFDGDVRLGDYFVHDLSAGGALLVSGPYLERGKTFRLLLQVAGLGHLRLDGEIVHATRTRAGASALGVKFRQLTPEVEDGLEQLVRQELERTSTPAILVVEANLHRLAQIADGLAQLGERPLLARTSLEVIQRLSAGDVEICGVITGGSHGSRHHALLDFLCEEFPSVRCFHLEGDVDEEHLRDLVESLLEPSSVPQLEVSRAGAGRDTLRSPAPISG